MKLGPTDNSNFGVIDYFTPYDQGVIDDMDLDYGASGVIALPDQSVGPPIFFSPEAKRERLPPQRRQPRAIPCQ